MSNETMAVEEQPRRWPLVIGGLLVLAVGVVVGWATTVVMTPAEEALESTPYTYVAVASGEVGASIQLNTVAEWTPMPVGTNRAAGVVTSIAIAPGDEVDQGSPLYTVDLRPVVVAHGAVPAFRAIAEGAEGADVTQLQMMLSARGAYSGPADGEAGAETIRGIKAWQKSMGLAQTGVLEPGDVIFVPTLPARVALDDDLVFRGATLSGGEEILRGLPAEPSFAVPVTETQAAMMPAGTRVEIASPEGQTWVGFAAAQRTDAETSIITVDLAAEGGISICAAECGQVPVTGGALLRSRIVTAETVTGLVLPSAALITSADGKIGVITDNGDRLSVKVIAAARGMSVVEGVAAGTRVRVPATGEAG